MGGGVKEISLTRGRVTLVDATDFDWLSQWKWQVAGAPGNEYVSRTVRGDDGVRRKVFMHRLIIAPPPGFAVDHIDRDTFNNTRANLRIATTSQNCANRALKPGKLKGVSVERSGVNRFRAHIRVRGELLRLGWYPSAEEAARVYDAAALHHFGEFAVLNFPEAA